MNDFGRRVSQVFQTLKKFGYNYNTFKFIKETRVGSGQGLVKLETRRLQHPVYLRKNTCDVEVFGSIFLQEEYAMNLDFEPRVIIDCGANIGLTTIYLKNLYPNATIICIEPELENYEILLKNTEHYKDIICYNAGVWSRSTSLMIEDAGLGSWGFTVKEVDHEVPGSIKGISLRDIIKENNIETIDVLKIDIEGSEKEVFEANSDEWLSRTQVLAVELHDRMKAGASKAVFKALVQYDFSLTFRGETAFCNFY